MVFLYGAKFWTPRVARGIKGSGPCLTFGHFKFKNEAKKLELESTHPETLAIYTHTLKGLGGFLIANQLNHVVFISIYTPLAATQRGFLKV